jgi:hypothetical protein
MFNLFLSVISELGKKMIKKVAQARPHFPIYIGKQAENPTSQGSPTNAGSYLLPHPAVTVGRLQPAFGCLPQRPLCACFPLQEFFVCLFQIFLLKFAVLFCIILKDFVL